MTTTTGRIDIADVRARYPIEQVAAAEGVELHRTGRGWLAHCPFHDDATASLSIAGVPERFHCFGCGATGDVIDFIARLRELGFRDAVTYLDGHPDVGMPPTCLPDDARAAGVAAQQPVPDVPAGRGYAINALAWAWFARPVPHAFAAAFLRHHRGIDLKVAERRLDGPLVGHTGHGWTPLTDHLRGAGVTDAELVAMDLARPGRYGLIDTLRDRLVVPIRATGGRVAGFVGRDTGGRPAAPKYRNPTRTPTFAKADCLYRPGGPVAPGGTVIVVEGALDALAVTAAAAQAGRLGRTGACSTLGVTVSPGQAAQVAASTTGPVVIALDGDAAGRGGTLAWVEALAGELAHPVLVTSLPEQADPADWLARHGVAGLAALDPAIPHTPGWPRPRRPGPEPAAHAHIRHHRPVRLGSAGLPGPPPPGPLL